MTHRSKSQKEQFLDMKLDEIQELVDGLREPGEIESMSTKHIDSLYKACMNFEQRLDRRS